jgi:hypothetical protein
LINGPIKGNLAWPPHARLPACPPAKTSHRNEKKKKKENAGTAIDLTE